MRVDDELEKGEEEEGGEEERDDILILGLDDVDEEKKRGDGEEKEDKEDQEEGKRDEEEGGEDGGREESGKEEKAQPTIKEILAEAREALREEGKGEEEKKGPKVYTIEELNEAEDNLAAMMDNEQIDHVTYVKYMRNIAQIRKSIEDEALVLNLESKRVRQSAEDNLTQWAESNAPEYLDVRKKETRDAVQWAKEYLGAEQKGDMWIVPKKVGQIMFGVLHKGNQSAKEGGEKKKDGGNEKGVKDAQKRDAELRGRDTRLPKGGDKKHEEAPATAEEREVMEALGLSDLKKYRKMKKMSGSKMSTVQVG